MPDAVKLCTAEVLPEHVTNPVKVDTEFVMVAAAVVKLTS